DPGLYVPVDFAESTLSVLATSLRAGASPVLVTGPRGIGKTLLLHVLAQRERDRFARVHYADELPHSANDLAGWLVRVLFGAAPPRSRAAALALRDRLLAPDEGRTLLLVDDLQCASDDAIAALAQIARANKPALAIVAAGTGLEDLPSATRALGAAFTLMLPE